MATTKKRAHKDGSVSFEIRVSLGRDINGKQILKYHTWTPSPGMKPRQIEKALEREEVLFEEKCRTGKVLDTSAKFADFAARWLDANEDIFSPAYKYTAADLLARINIAIGNIPLDKLRPHHLQELYRNLAEAGVKKTKATAVTHKLAGLLKERGITRAALSQAAGVAPITITTACRGKNVNSDTANRIAAALGMQVTELFTVTAAKERLSPRTILHHHRLISSILETAVKWQLLYDNPARRVTTPKVPKKEATFLDDKEVVLVARRLLDAPVKWRTILMLLMFSGMRRGEACGLTYSDIDFSGNLIHITKANQYLPGLGIFEKSTKTESSDRVIKLPPEMMDILREYKEWHTGERTKMGDLWQETGKVFTQENGLPISPDSITAWTKEFREAHSLPRFTPKSLRHTSATLLIMSGVPVRAVAARLGHSDVSTTNSIYSHAIQTADALASDIIGDIIKLPGAKREGAGANQELVSGHFKPHKNLTS